MSKIWWKSFGSLIVELRTRSKIWATKAPLLGSFWLYNYLFLSGHISDKMTKDLKLDLNEIFSILKNEKDFDLLDETGQFKSEELKKVYSQASTILIHLKATLSKVA